MNKENLSQMYTAEQLADMYLLVADNYDKHIKNTGAIIDDLKARIAELESRLAESDMGEKAKSDCLKNEIEHYKRAMMQVGDVLMEFFNVTHEIAEEPSGFDKVLQETVGKDKTIPAFLPNEPICVAEMLISARKEHECSPFEKLITEKDKYMGNMFDISELRQIAEYLLVYCDCNEE